MNMFPFNFIGRDTSPVEPLLLEEYKLDENEVVYHRDNDVGLLFNQERVAKSVGVDTINAWLKQMSSNLASSNPTVVDTLRQKIGDDALAKFVKSRHLQTPSELLVWSDYINQTYGDEVARYEELKADLEATVEPVEPTKPLVSSANGADPVPTA